MNRLFPSLAVASSLVGCAPRQESEDFTAYPVEACVEHYDTERAKKLAPSYVDGIHFDLLNVQKEAYDELSGVVTWVLMGVLEEVEDHDWTIPDCQSFLGRQLSVLGTDFAGNFENTHMQCQANVLSVSLPFDLETSSQWGVSALYQCEDYIPIDGEFFVYEDFSLEQEGEEPSDIDPYDPAFLTHALVSDTLWGEPEVGQSVLNE